jgi:hypothetical protein
MLPGKCARVRKEERVCRGGVNEKGGGVFKKRKQKERETQRAKFSAALHCF